MTPNWNKIIERVLEHEGGYVNHPKDPGGATNLGITQRVFDEYLAASGIKPYSVKLITRSQAMSIYRVKYWMRIKGDELQHGWDYAMMDAAVNSGPKRAVEWAQEVLGLTVDGVMGPKTRAAIHHAPKEKLNEYMDKRLAFLKSLDTWATFGKGWGKRVEHVRTLALKDWGLTGR